MDYTATLEEPHLRDDHLTAPPRNVAIVAAGLATAVVVTCGGYALAGSPYPTIICAPFLVGGVVGLIAYKCPIRWACAAILAAVAFVVWEAGAYALWLLPALIFILPTTILGSVVTAAVRRYRRGRHARRLLGIVLD